MPCLPSCSYVTAGNFCTHNYFARNFYSRNFCARQLFYAWHFCAWLQLTEFLRNSFMGWLSSFFIHVCIVVRAPLETIRHWYSSHSVHSKFHDWAHATEDRNKVSRGLYRSCWPGVVWVAVVVGHTDVHEGGVVTQRQQPVQYSTNIFSSNILKNEKKRAQTILNIYLLYCVIFAIHTIKENFQDIYENLLHCVYSEFRAFFRKAHCTLLGFYTIISILSYIWRNHLTCNKLKGNCYSGRQIFKIFFNELWESKQKCTTHGFFGKILQLNTYCNTFVHSVATCMVCTV